RKVDQLLDHDTDLVPCPHCGQYQPDMIGQRRSPWHLVSTIAGAVLLVAVFAASLGRIVSQPPAIWTLAVVGVVAAAFHTLLVCLNPNGNPERALERAAELQQSDALRADESGETIETARGYLRSGRNWLTLILVAALWLGIGLVLSA